MKLPNKLKFIMEQKGKRSVVKVMRALHRDIGFLMVGLMVIYSLSGSLLIHRGTNFMKHDVKSERTLSPNMTMEEVASNLWIRDTNGAKTEGDVISFANGATYNVVTGETVSVSSELIYPFNKFTLLHKTGGNTVGKIFTTISGILLFFLAISSFWMYKPENKNFKRGIILGAIGIVLAIVIVMTSQMGGMPSH